MMMILFLNCWNRARKMQFQASTNSNGIPSCTITDNSNAPHSKTQYERSDLGLSAVRVFSAGAKPNDRTDVLLRSKSVSENERLIGFIISMA